MGEDVSEWMFEYENDTDEEDDDEESEEDSDDESDDYDDEEVKANWHKLKEVKNLERY